MQQTSDLTTELKFYAVLEDVFGRHYADVKERFQLEFTPNCLYDLEKCSRIHSKKTKINQINRHLQELLDIDKPQLFLNLISNLNMTNYFPGSKNLLAVLQLLLTINKPSHKGYTTNDIIYSCCSVFENVLKNFPPCWYEMRSKYTWILQEPTEIDFSLNSFEKNRDGIFKICIDILEKVLQNDGKDIDTPVVNMNDSQPFSDPMTSNFYYYERTYAQKYKLHLISRDDKITRIFLILHLLIKLMEWDLAAWSLRHIKNINTTITDPMKSPLIVHLIWPNGDCGSINSFIVKTIEIFIMCIEIGMPQEKIEILARFLNIIAQVINITNFQINSDKIEFPRIYNNTEKFAEHIWKALKKANSTSVDLFLAVIYNIRTHFIRLILINHLLITFNSHSMKICLKKIYINMDKKRWTECLQNGTRNLFTFIPNKNSSKTIYPVYSAKKQIAFQRDIYSLDYLELVFEYFKSYLFVYRTHEIINPKNHQTTPQKNNGVIFENRKIFKSQKYNFVQIEKDIYGLQRALMEKAKKIKIPAEETNQRKPLKMFNILINSAIVLKHRDDMKWYLLLLELIEKYRQIHGEAIFDKWLQCFEKNSNLFT